MVSRTHFRGKQRSLCLVLVAMLLVSAFGCLPPADPPQIAWYVLSPKPDVNYPMGNSSAPISTWEQINAFPTVDECEDSLKAVASRINRPVECFASNDPLLKHSGIVPVPEPSPAGSAP